MPFQSKTTVDIFIKVFGRFELLLADRESDRRRPLTRGVQPDILLLICPLRQVFFLRYSPASCLRASVKQALLPGMKRVAS